MKRIVISMALAGAVFGVVVTAGPTREAKADIAGDIFDACRADWQRCYSTAQTSFAIAVAVYQFIDDAFTGVSYLEECIGEGCSTEEVREDYASYHEEMIGEGGGSFEEIKETVFHDSHRSKLDDMRAGGRMTYLGIAARQLGEPALADAAEALGRRMWQSTDPARPEADLDPLLVEQAALVARFQDLARRHPDDPSLIVLVGRVHEDLVATASGTPRPIDHKLETEDDEGPRHNEIEDDDHKGAGTPPAPE